MTICIHWKGTGTGHRRRINKEEMGKVVAAVWGDVFESRNELKKRFLDEHPIWKVVVWWGMNRVSIHFFKASIPPSSCYPFHPFLSIIVVQNSKQQWQPLPALLYLSFFYRTGSGDAEMNQLFSEGLEEVWAQKQSQRSLLLFGGNIYSIVRRTSCFALVNL